MHTQVLWPSVLRSNYPGEPISKAIWILLKQETVSGSGSHNYVVFLLTTRTTTTTITTTTKNNVMIEKKFANKFVKFLCKILVYRRK